MKQTILVSIFLVLFLSILTSCSSLPESEGDNQDIVDALEEEQVDVGESDEVEEEVSDSELEEDTDDSESEEGGEELAEEDSEDQEEDLAESEDFEEGEEEELAEEDDFDEEENEQLAEEELEEESNQEEAQVAQETQAVPPSSAPSEVSNISFNANDSGGTVIIQTTSPVEYKTRLNPQTSQFVIEIPNAGLPEKLKRPYILKEFDSAFAAINAYQNPESNVARVVIQLKDGGSPTVQQEGNSIIVIPSGMAMAQQEPVPPPADQGAEESAPPSEAWKESYDTATASRMEGVLGARTLDEFLTENNQFFGRRISIEVKETDVRDVVDFIAQESGVNIVMTDDVKGKMTIKLRKVPWDQALVIVMKSNKLGYLRQGNVIRISSLENLKKETDTAKAIIESQKALSPLKVKVIPVSFAKVEDMVKQIQPFLTNSRGKIVSDTRTSSIILTDTDEVIRKMSRLVKELDIPPAQVMIEGKIVEAKEDFQQSIGMNWGFGGQAVELSKDGGADGAPINLTSGLSVQPVSKDLEPLGQFSINVQTLDFLGDLNAALTLAENDQLVKIISSPRIVTINKEEAEITQMGQVVSIATVNNQGVTTKTVERTPFELKLHVVPQVTNDGSVLLNVNVKREFPGPVVETSTLARAVNTRTAKTKVLVKNGQTAVIGGIYSNDENQSDRGIPGLKNIPVLGWLFKERTQEKTKNELLIFLTPRVLNIRDQGAKESTATAAG